MLREMDASKAEPPVAENEAPEKAEAQAVPLTPVAGNEASKKAEEAQPSPVQEFSDRINQLIDDATAEGLRPLPVVATILAKRGMGLIDQARARAADVAERFLTSLEGSSRAKPEKK